jgi:hypothetical protein
MDATSLVLIAFLCGVSLALIAWLLFENVEVMKSVNSTLTDITDALENDTCNKSDVKEAVRDAYDNTNGQE